ncbi:hypothetical protein ACH5RR_025893 [Cinchona calisaya]|uniref:Uncharacterized protein n=1 Tax=Cinchona calisaya TaxID=153742 RepID=A0ABD2Z2W3_9GENT
MNEPNGMHLESIVDIDQLPSKNEISLENFDCSTKEFNAQVTMPSDKKPPPSIVASQGKKRNVSIDEELDILKYTLDNVAEAIREGNFVLQKSRACAYFEEEIFNKLVVVDIEADLIDDCYIFLTQKPVKARSFFGCPGERCKSILNKLMNGL